MSRLAFAAATLLAAGTLASGAQAASFSDNFNAEPVQVPVEGDSMVNWSVSSGTGASVGGVDVVDNDTYSIFCLGGAGRCVDLDGTPGPGRITSRDSVSFGENELITLSFYASGNQRNDGSDNLYAGFIFDGAHDITRSTGGAFGDFTSGPVTKSQFRFDADVSGDAFKLYSISFTSTSAGSARAFLGTTSHDNVGPVVDNVTFGTAVPEPATWAMMLLGFGGMGAVLRRRRAYA